MHKQSKNDQIIDRSKDALSVLSPSFGLICWNISKHNDTARLSRRIKTLERIWNLQLLLFQEAPLHLLPGILPSCYSIYDQSNLRFGTTSYGVAIISRIPSIKTIGGQNRCRELYLGPKKGYILTHYPLSNGRTLLCLNIHAINFREHSGYRRELNNLREMLEEHEGPMIVAGDFNRWNQARKDGLIDFAKTLGLQSIEADNGVKRFMGHPLDFVFDRELKILKSDVSKEEISDHNPLLAEFTIE